VIWSFSHFRAFQRCQRQWFYGCVFANALAKDAERREAKRLSRLTTVHAWKGKLVDEVISRTVVPAVKRGCEVSFDHAKRVALDLFERQRPAEGCQRDNGSIKDLSSSAVPCFYEIEYGEPLTAGTIAQTWIDIENALKAFFRNGALRDLLKQACALVAQRPLSFRLDDLAIRAVPDLIAFHTENEPSIIDWKVHTKPVHDYWLQLATYAIALTRCKRHCDWPQLSADIAPPDVQLLEVQLLTDRLRVHKVSDEDVMEVEDLIASSAVEMALAMGSDSKKLRPRDFPVASNPRVCQVCNFRKMCWVSKP
jgi:hypothetical protein